MLKKKDDGYKILSPKFSVMQEKHTREIDTLIEVSDSTQATVHALQKRVELLEGQLSDLKQEVQTLIKLASVKGTAH